MERQGIRVSRFTVTVLALVARRQETAACALLRTDYTLPLLSGPQVAREARAIRADLPGVVICGFVDEALRAQAALGGPARSAAPGRYDPGARRHGAARHHSAGAAAGRPDERCMPATRPASAAALATGAHEQSGYARGLAARGRALRRHREPPHTERC